MANFDVSIMEKKKLNILFITNEYPTITKNHFYYGGQASYIKNITDLLSKKKNIKITIWILSNRIFSYSKKNIIIKEIGINLSILGNFGRVINNLLISIYVFFLKKNKFDIVQYPSFFPIGIFIFFPKKILKVCRISGITSLWRKTNGNKQNLLHKLSDFFEKKRIFNSDKVFSPSKLISKFIYKNFKKKISVLPSPINKNLKINKKKINITNFLLFVGSINKVKGFDILEIAIQKIFKKNKLLNLVIIGSNKYNLLQNTEENYKKIKNRIFYLGPVKKNLLYNFYKKALAVVIPSRVDNYSNVMLEALYFKKIIIAFKNSSIDEIIKNKIHGFIAKKKNYISLISSIEQYLKQNKFQKKIMNTNISRLLNKLQNIDYAEELITFYQQVKR
jgi:glycosyltransferase involved in cell wall biosynthesis